MRVYSSQPKARGCPVRTRTGAGFSKDSLKAEMGALLTRRLVLTAAVYGVIWFSCVLWFWVSLATGNTGGGWIMAYTLACFYIALPLATFAASFSLGLTAALGWRRILAPLAFALLYVCAMLLTFSLSTALGLARIAGADFIAFLFGLAPGVVGCTLGALISAKKERVS